MIMIIGLGLNKAERLVGQIMGEASWTDPARYRYAVWVGTACPEAVDDLPFIESLVDRGPP